MTVKCVLKYIRPLSSFIWFYILYSTTFAIVWLPRTVILQFCFWFLWNDIWMLVIIEKTGNYPSIQSLSNSMDFLFTTNTHQFSLPLAFNWNLTVLSLLFLKCYNSVLLITPIQSDKNPNAFCGYNNWIDTQIHIEHRT